ncbi:MAG: hydantoinase/oxoprolinase family protein [Actinomycetia bacterium]|nr:hydantoinase/oxoprolinase family protein [Actinomycetes bacterium]
MTYRVGIDSGGTFTDLVAIADDGVVRLHKVPSNREAPAQALLEGLAGLAEQVGLPLRAFIADCELVVLGTTVALNALLQRRGAKTALLATEGHEDSIEIRLGHKEDGHRWDFSFPPATPLVPAYLRLPVHERVLADATVYTPLDEEQAAQSVRALKEHDVDAVAVSFMWSFQHPEHERRVAELVRQALPECYISLSTDVLPRVGEYTRTSTTVVNAYVGPRLTAYMRDIEQSLVQRGFRGTVYYMQSNGGLGTQSILERRPVAALGSGPAAGPVAALQLASLLGHENVISIDMGGTSFDVCLVKDGLPDVVAEVDVARYRVGLPMVNVESIGAGGGSIARVDEKGVLQVGPESAEADPGPACYGRGGTRPTVTDALVVLGYLPSDALLGGRMPIESERSVHVIEAEVAGPLGISVDAAAQGIVELAAANMVEGIRMASIQRGHDPRDFVMVAGGGAGPTFAGLLAAELGIGTVLIPKVAGAMCAFGEAAADLRYDAVRSYAARLSDVEPADLDGLFSQMEREGEEALVGATLTEGGVRVERAADMKYVDQIHHCDVPVPTGTLTDSELATLRERFHARHAQLYTYCERDNEPELLSIRASVILKQVQPTLTSSGSTDAPRAATATTRAILLPGALERVDVPVLAGERVPSEQPVEGPAIIEEETATIAVFPGMSASVLPHGLYRLTVPEAGVR